MSSFHFDNEKFLQHCVDLVVRERIESERLTQQQIAESLRQAILAGDFVRMVSTDGRQGVAYIPFREVESIRDKYNELIMAVESKHEGETRHETALRYIRERENIGKNSEPQEAA
jgi:hypothetical protein